MTSPEFDAREEQFVCLVAACDEALEAGLAATSTSSQANGCGWNGGKSMSS